MFGSVTTISSNRGLYDFELEFCGELDDNFADFKQNVKKIQSNFAEELGITDNKLDLLEWATQEKSSQYELIYDFFVTFDDQYPPQILKKLKDCQRI